MKNTYSPKQFGSLIGRKTHFLSHSKINIPVEF